MLTAPPKREGRYQLEGPVLVMTVAVVALALIFDFSNGFHDAANVVATIIVTGALSPAKALTIAAICEFIGPFLFGTAVAKTIGEVQAVLVANHGVVCCGRDLPEALVASQIVEKAAQMMLAASPGGKLHRIPQKLVQEERHRYLYKYGTPHD
jgi:hypothetical protein